MSPREMSPTEIEKIALELEDSVRTKKIAECSKLISEAIRAAAREEIAEDIFALGAMSAVVSLSYIFAKRVVERDAKDADIPLKDLGEMLRTLPGRLVWQMFHAAITDVEAEQKAQAILTA